MSVLVGSYEASRSMTWRQVKKPFKVELKKLSLWEFKLKFGTNLCILSETNSQKIRISDKKNKAPNTRFIRKTNNIMTIRVTINTPFRS